MLKGRVGDGLRIFKGREVIVQIIINFKTSNLS